MSDNTASQDRGPQGPGTIAELLEGLRPMGDLEQLAVEDLTAEEADEFFQILEDA